MKTPRKNTLEAAILPILQSYPDGTTFDVIAHELWRDGVGWSVNDSWKLGRECDIEETLEHCRGRFEVFKVNYSSKARVITLEDENWSGAEYPALLSIEGIPFMEIRPIFAEIAATA